MSNFICIYHGSCDDGFAAAFVYWLAYGDRDVSFFPGKFYEAPPDVTGKNVVILDFSYLPEIMKDIQAKSNSLLWIDHHISAIKANADLVPRDQDKFILESEQKECGASLTFNYLSKACPHLEPSIRPKAEFISYIRDRDLWEKKLPQGTEFSMALRTYPQIFEIWDRLSERLGVYTLIQEGTPMLKMFNANVEMLAKRRYYDTIKGYHVPIVNTNKIYCSEVGEILAEDNPFGATWEYDNSMYVFSLRSTKNGIDVSEIARKFPGGGGHKTAAGFSVKSLEDLK